MAEEKQPKGHKLSWYKKGRTIHVDDKMQTYKYVLEADPGKDFDPKFKPQLTPQEMLARGVFEGKYLNDCRGEFPVEWYEHGKFVPPGGVADPSLNEFEIKSRLPLSEWIEKGWIPAVEGDPDCRGWFQWYCRYWLGRRIPILDKKQIARWCSFARHAGAIKARVAKLPAAERPKTRAQKKSLYPRQRQALLQWAYDPYV